MIRWIAAARGHRPHAARRAALAAALAAVSWLGCGADADGLLASDAASEGLVVARAVGGANEIVQLRVSDAAERALTATPDRDERWPYWSDAARRLVFQSEPVGGGRSALMLWDPERGAAEPLHPAGGRDERWPVWSPDGRRLAYAFRDDGPFAGILAEPLDGGPPRILAASGRADFFFRPSYAPDGERLVAQRRGPDGSGSTLWILGGALPEPLTDDPARFDMKAWFTRDGRRVVFSRRRLPTARRDVAIVDAGGGPVRLLVASPDADEHSGRPSPTRDEIAYCSDESGATNVYRVGLDGGAPRALTRWSDREAFAPRWSPDGERLVVTAQPLGARPGSIARARVVVLDREGAVLLDAPGAMPDWMPPWR